MELGIIGRPGDHALSFVMGIRKQGQDNENVISLSLPMVAKIALVKRMRMKFVGMRLALV